MSDQAKEPSQWAQDAARRIANTPFLRAIDSTLPRWKDHVQAAIDAATAQKDAQIERLQAEFDTGCEIIQQKDQRIAALESLLDQAMEVFRNYLNVPESRDLREKWEKLKSQ